MLTEETGERERGRETVREREKREAERDRERKRERAFWVGRNKKKKWQKDVAKR